MFRFRFFIVQSFLAIGVVGSKGLSNDVHGLPLLSNVKRNRALNVVLDMRWLVTVLFIAQAHLVSLAAQASLGQHR